MTSSILCVKCNGSIPSVSGICRDCKFEITDESVIDKHLKLKSTIKSVLIQKFNEQTIHNLLGESMEIFHPYDEDFLELLNISFALYQTKNNHKKRLEIAQLILINHYANRCRYDPTIAILEMTVANLFILFNLVKDAELHINKAKDILDVAYGCEQTEVTKKWKQIFQEISFYKKEIA